MFTERGKTLLLCLVGILGPSLAPSAAMSASMCESLNSPKEVLSCALERHPIAVDAQLAREQAEDGLGLARQMPNPEVNNQTLFGGERSGDFYSEFNFAHTFELGGKRAARIKGAEAGQKIAEASGLNARQEVYLSTVLTLLRLRQIQSELSAIEDALNTFGKLARQYRSRPKLSPEQRASLRIFEIAEQDYRLQRAPLEAETTLRLEDLEMAVGKHLDADPKLTIAKRKDWPNLPKLTESVADAKILEARAKLNRAEADLATSRGLAWPDVKLGPTVTTTKRVGMSYETYGLNLTMPLPFYHRNGAGRAFASKGLDRANLDLRVAEREIHHREQYLRKRYESAVDALKKTSNSSDLSRKHEEIEKMFSQGFLNGTVVVEIHRQVAEFTKAQNEQELVAIESLIRYHNLNGTIPEVLP